MGVIPFKYQYEKYWQPTPLHSGVTQYAELLELEELLKLLELVLELELLEPILQRWLL